MAEALATTPQPSATLLSPALESSDHFEDAASSPSPATAPAESSSPSSSSRRPSVSATTPDFQSPEASTPADLGMASLSVDGGSPGPSSHRDSFATIAPSGKRESVAVGSTSEQGDKESGDAGLDMGSAGDVGLGLTDVELGDEKDEQTPSARNGDGGEHETASEGGRARPFSLVTPTTPNGSYLPSTSGATSKNGTGKHDSTSDGDDLRQRPSVTSTIWRNSVATSPLSNVSLDDDALGAPSRDRSSSSASGSSKNSQAPGGGVGNSSLDLKRRTVASFGSMGSEALSPGGQSNYDLLMNRLEVQSQEMEGDPKAKRQSANGTGKLQKNFERIHDELKGEEEVMIDWDFWGAVMSDYEHVAKTQPRELSRAIQKGIPPVLRGMMWQLMSSSKDPDLEHVYSQFLKMPSQHEKTIIRDLGRTYPKHQFFAEQNGLGQENLFNVVKAYSLYDDDIGYCQGLQFIVGPLLLNMPDEEAFCVLVRLMKSYDLRSHFVPDMPGLQLRLFQFDRLVEELLPHIYMHLLRQGIKSSMYASQWFLTLFGYRFPMDLICSVLDLVFAEGVEAIFRFSIALLKRNEKDICALEFEQLLEFLKGGLFECYVAEPDELDANGDQLYRAHDFVREALQVKVTPVMLDSFAAEWDNLCRQQNAHILEVEGLRAVNAKLSNQVRRLESSLAQINEEHCNLVKQVVMAKLEKEELEEELVKYKVLFADLSHRSMDRQSSYSSQRSSGPRDTPTVAPAALPTPTELVSSPPTIPTSVEPAPATSI